MAKQRGVLKALIMGCVPLLHIFLFYCWCNEAKVRWRIAHLNSTLYALLFILPLINIYPLFRLLDHVERNLAKAGKPGYQVKPLYLAILMYVAFPVLLLPGTLVCPIILVAVIIPVLTWLYIVYRTQTLFNENGVKSLY